MSIEQALLRKKLEYLELYWFYQVLSLSIGGMDALRVLKDLIDHGLEFYAAPKGHLGHAAKVHPGDVKVALVKVERALERELEDENPSESQVFEQISVPVNDSTPNAYKLPVGRLYVYEKSVKEIYSALGEEQYPWPITFGPGSNDQWKWVSTKNDSLSPVSATLPTAKEGRTEDPLQDKSLRKDQRHRERCRALAAYLWHLNPNTTTADMAKSDALHIYGCEEKIYRHETIERWISDLNPDPKIGRPPSKK